MALKPLEKDVLKKLTDAGLSPDQIKALDKTYNHNVFSKTSGPSTTAKQSSTSASPEYKSTAGKSTFAGGYTARKAGDILNAARRKTEGARTRNPNYKSTAEKSDFAGGFVARKIGDAVSGKNPANSKIGNFNKPSSRAAKATRKARQEAAARALEKNGSAFYKASEADRKKKKKAS